MLNLVVRKVLESLRNLTVGGGIRPFVNTPYWCAEEQLYL